MEPYQKIDQYSVVGLWWTCDTSDFGGDTRWHMTCSFTLETLCHDTQHCDNNICVVSVHWDDTALSWIDNNNLTTTLALTANSWVWHYNITVRHSVWETHPRKIWVTDTHQALVMSLKITGNYVTGWSQSEWWHCYHWWHCWSLPRVNTGHTNSTLGLLSVSVVSTRLTLASSVGQ